MVVCRLLVVELYKHAKMENKRFLRLGGITAYKMAFHPSNYVWNVISECDLFVKKTIGAQFTDAVGSIYANIAKGFGRFHKNDKIRFYHISQGSI